jgi:hypothetical protein
VQRYNPGIRTPNDYLAMVVRASKGKVHAPPADVPQEKEIPIYGPQKPVEEPPSWTEHAVEIVTLPGAYAMEKAAEARTAASSAASAAAERAKAAAAATYEAAKSWWGGAETPPPGTEGFVWVGSTNTGSTRIRRSAPLQEIEAAQQELAKQWLGKSGVNAIDYNRFRSGPVFTVDTTTGQSPAGLPKKWRGVPVVVRKGGPYYAQDGLRVA